ncbi:bifunctional diaminohydroxyphosphoribosylaminopyrimidine deaminase/5-amino-6-(5-phosphoribosylamino)uracil reductase RibD [Paenibacillus antri]|uniref:Riboflavin biosynthesis protein RibD n=1 Tax=Paenibacillus antri TaxID=2582848 RepID=A0A5R9GBD0_9BACL|nr:bifunctional diaminohydroxyphosphoribosylaminopyrimidine deaminase/5-amino-6-(5-phosphoribosylamino)uracil reductase RibD [Paenibacillus antri]TLS53041.1 bifunctional diaminohydroxyphosphoribosylaminopyrimidine deaminase/5-amino-6-(5-phosphoribosylamino)uracil reductase RibD [Paenibacillus antri]
MEDEDYMRLALTLGKAALGQTGTNPSVGCVVAKHGRIVGMGAHLRQGEAHAEVHALDMAGAEAAGSTVYVTLEPCSHHGRTPPCADRLVREGVKRVVVATQDPNPQVAGRGIARLREHGIEVTVGVLGEEAASLHEAFFHAIRIGRPFVAAKTAMTLDGRIAAKTGDSKWITNAASRAFVHELRHRYPAILVGVGTVLADDPSLTARGDAAPKRDPMRAIVDSRLRTPLHAAALSPRADGEPPAIVLTTATADAAARSALEAHGAVVVDCGPGPRVDLELALRELYRLGIGAVLVEGGGAVTGALLAAGLVDKTYAFVAPKIVGAGGPSGFEFPSVDRMADAIRLDRLKVRTFDGDVLFEGYPVYSKETR